jgi:ATP-binding cassette, subfamily C (CFTR/MRP), member 1
MYFFAVSQNGATLRGALIESLYVKSLKIHISGTASLGPAGAVNLMAADTERIIKALDPIHELWSGMILIAVGLYILYTRLKLIFLAVSLFSSLEFRRI